MSAPLDPPRATGAGRRELPAYLSNGLMGLRVRENPLMAGMALLCGYSGLHPQRKIEAAAVAPYPFAGNLSIDGVWLGDVPHLVTVVDQAYDFSSGELSTHLRFGVGEVTADIEVLTFCCRHQPTLAVQQVTVRVDRACGLKLQSLVDTDGIEGYLECHTAKPPGEDKNEIDGSLCWKSAAGFSHCGIALVTQMGDSAQREKPGGGRQSHLITQYGLRARAGRPYVLRQIVSMVPSVLHAQPDRQAERMVALAAHYGFAALRAANRAEWDELWKGRILLHGAGRNWQQLADAALFYLNSSVHVGSPASTSMFGLATWHDYHYYYGHVMWDIETFAVPPLTFLQPEGAAALLQYRSRSLAAARSNAQCMGRGGLQFPWESGPSTGEEAAPSPGRAAWHEDHVSMDVALAFLHFARATGNRNFLRDRTWPILAGVADWIVSRSHRSRRGFEIRRCMGIAEREQECDNEAYTMLSARAVLEGALEVAGLLGRTPGNQWREIADRLVLPLRDGVLVSHDDFRANEEKAATPSPLMGLFPLWSELPPRVWERTLDYYLPRAKAYIGSPMLSAFYGVWAAERGKRDLAAKLLEEGYSQFVAGRFLQTLEYRPDRFPEQPIAGPFFANMGGFMMSLLQGFPALKLNDGPPSTWPQRDVILPEGWKEIEVERLWLHGRPARLRARQGKRTTLEFLDR